MKPFINLFINSLAVFLTAYLLPGVIIESYVAVIIVALLIGIFNVVVKPLLLLLTLPITIMTLGLFTFIINGVMIVVISYLVPEFSLDHFGWAILFSIVLSIINSVLHSILK